MVSALTVLGLGKLEARYASDEDFSELIRQRFTDPKEKGGLKDTGRGGCAGRQYPVAIVKQLPVISLRGIIFSPRSRAASRSKIVSIWAQLGLRARNGRLTPLTQENHRQALSVPPTRKYQDEGDPGHRGDQCPADRQRRAVATGRIS